MKTKIDLHIHTNYSDGTDSPEKVLELACSNGLQYISITDHESMQAYKNIKNMNKYKVTLIPGVELHTYFKGYEIHLLGYGLDYNNNDLDSFMRKLRLGRTEVAYETVKRIRLAGVDLQWSEVLKMAGDDVAITKAHLIAALKNLNIFDRKFYYNFFNTSGKEYIPYQENTLPDAINLIRSYNAKPVLAHPGLIGDDKLVEEILKKYQVGLEVYYNYYGNQRENWIKKYETMASYYDTIYTGGSDYHGHITPSELGGIYVPELVIEQLLV